ncbi:hypothetical protein [Burkholderia cenocepacia]|uniref:hypothetical protein n=1 Tax=Burkholderia cenocepacia TaxID=95486 RepID=UPI000AFA34E7|nr:hypothetical protein [Burkholderia cenocepacia]
MKLCINCRYFEANNLPPVPKSFIRPVIANPQPGFGRCLHPSTVDHTSPVSGELVRDIGRTSVRDQRYVPHIFAVLFNKCGQRGRHFAEIQRNLDGNEKA